MSVVLEMGKFHKAKSSEISHFQHNKSGSYLSQIFTALPMLFHVNTILADFYWCFHVCGVLKHMSY